ncbi:hypothetical protein EOB59_32075 [Mesorhizobium sp. M7A.F.Ca.MR.176.00.0.0]|uniref:hypothetical protein n=1 Tax=Mesorhizobium sp. M7A.F.Ca.MR.176.00.0.0 TaxID=2496776 RepID=UPI000FD572E1|nr:hypothetical protein [Mesorhizobium sp. M7A.F.Ca.MR.176.00.0.0]RUU85432.1 hypothetical protein EOB59_32075 [Mesorhizobium sp. M7A.F.Ca.MR.176.00.0.0]
MAGDRQKSAGPACLPLHLAAGPFLASGWHASVHRHLDVFASVWRGFTFAPPRYGTPASANGILLGSRRKNADAEPIALVKLRRAG